MSKIITIVLIALVSVMGVSAAKADEPFGAAHAAAPARTQGDWQYTIRNIDLDRIAIEKCRTQHECPPEAKRFVDILDEADSQIGVARIGHLNRGMNLAFKATDKNCVASDAWTSPLATLREGCGVCKQHAILKAVALRIMGYKVRIVVGHEQFTAAGDEHVVVAVWFEDSWLILDTSIAVGVLLPDNKKRGFTAYYSFELPDTPASPQS